MKLEAVRTEEQVGVLIEDAISRELAQAKAGERASVSTRAAARYLGKHINTLCDWRKQGLGPPYEKGQLGGGVRNEHVAYPWEPLVAWKSSRQGLTPTMRGKLDELDRLEERARILELEEQLRAARARLKPLEDRHRKRKPVEFATVADLAAEHDWAMVDGLVLGHVLTISDEGLARAIAGSVDNIVSMPVTDALALPWASFEDREPFEEAVHAALAGLASAIAKGGEDGERARAQLSLRELEDAVPAAAASYRGSPL